MVPKSATRAHINRLRYNSRGTSKSKNDELIQNYGQLTINGGILSGTTDNALYSATGSVIINNGSFRCNAKSKKVYFPVVINQKKSTMVINGGTFYGNGRAFDNVGVASISGGEFYSYKKEGIANFGSMTITGGRCISTAKSKSFAVFNCKKMVIESITCKGSICNDTKDGRLTIRGGSFTSSSKFMCFGNAKGNTTISGGHFSAKGHSTIYIQSGNVHVSGGIFYCKKANCIYILNKGSLTTNGGTFTSTNRYYALHNMGRANLISGKFITKGSRKNIYSPKGSKITKSSNVSGAIAR